jgi:hypothetical protein
MEDYNPKDSLSEIIEELLKVEADLGETENGQIVAFNVGRLMSIKDWLS